MAHKLFCRWEIPKYRLLREELVIIHNSIRDCTIEISHHQAWELLESYLAAGEGDGTDYHDEDLDDRAEYIYAYRVFCIRTVGAALKLSVRDD